MEDEGISIILRQTDLSEQEAKQLLENHKGDYMKALESYYGIKKVVKIPSTINQQIYNEIRNVMDDAAFKFYKERENQQ